MKRALEQLLGLAALILAGWLASRQQGTATPRAPAADSRVAQVIVRHPRLTAAAVVLLIALAGGVTVTSGVVPIKASSGHWAITEWFLQFAKRRSVATHSYTVEAPRLDDPGLVLRGAGHYDGGCRPCHGAPGEPLPAILSVMTPRPPDLVSRTAFWDAEELFYIVKHGIKFTGMPGWPAQQRDDEVWAVVAFLRRLPALRGNDYAQLARGGFADEGLAPVDEASPGSRPPRTVIETCARCHGVDGQGRGVGAFPRLAGQQAVYLANSLRAFATGARYSGIMRPFAAALSDATIADVSRYYASVSPVSGSVSSAAAPRDLTVSSARAASVERGGDIVSRGVPARDIPACAECHLPGVVSRNPAYPILSGQEAAYLRQQLQLLQAERRGGTPYVRLMRAFVDRLTPSEIDDVAAYFASHSVTADVPR
jgi:cytochrome c553